MSRVTLLHVSALYPHPANIRSDLGDLTELAASIRAHGILQPLIVAPHPSERHYYHVIAGHRRLAAAKLVKVSELPCLVRRAALPDTVAIQVMLIENCQRAGLNPMDKAEAMDKLRKTGMSGRDIARATGISDAHVSLHLTLLYLDGKGKARLRSGDLALHDAARLARDIRAGQPARTVRPRKRSAPDPDRPGWSTPYLASSHALAHTARTRCNAAGHSVRGRVGKVACGRCWEDAIRADERGEPREPEPVPLVKGSPEQKADHAKYERDRRALVRAGDDGGTYQVACCANCRHPGGLHLIDYGCRCCADCPGYEDGGEMPWSDRLTLEKAISGAEAKARGKQPRYAMRSAS